MQSISVFLDIAKFANFRWKMLMSAEFKACITWFVYFSDLLLLKCAKFHRCRIYVTDFMEGGGGGSYLPPLICGQPWKGPSWIRLTRIISPSKNKSSSNFLMFFLVANQPGTNFNVGRNASSDLSHIF